MTLSNKDFLAKIENFIKENNMSATRFGVDAKNDPKFVFRVRGGMEVKENGKEEVLSFIKNYADKTLEGGENGGEKGC